MKAQCREYPWGLDKFIADNLITAVAYYGLDTVTVALADLALDNGQEAASDLLEECGVKLSHLQKDDTP